MSVMRSAISLISVMRISVMKGNKNAKILIKIPPCRGRDAERIPAAFLLPKLADYKKALKSCKKY